MPYYSSNFFSSHFNFLNIKRRLYEYQDVLVCPRSGCAFNLQREPIIETLHDFLFWNPSILNVNAKSNDLEKEVDKRKRMLINPLQEKIRLDLKEHNILNLGKKITGIHLLSGFGWYPFGHFFDYLQKLFVMENRKYSSPLVLHSRSYGINNFTDHFNACGIPNDMLFECRHNFPTILVKKLVYVPPFIPAKLTPETSKWIAEKYTNYFVHQAKFKINENQRFFLFLDRHKVRPGSRSIINYSEVMSWVKSKGFKILDGTESLAEIVFYFSQAKFIFGAHGSLFANTVFLPQDCSIVEFCSEKRIDKSFFMKHKICQNYHWLKSESDQKNNVYVDINLMESYFNSSSINT
ncbi:glycosyltransferase 61 family protein [Dapis sp. BLCC M229]|uniref:glycosyltransferase 61 family protein n=1 Tax=Dapis sp. BLCC M229 TaxID=3400188 RepID=UPI003CF9E8FF